MKTVLTDDPLEAAAYIRKGELAVFPTETVYGLGGNALEAASVAKIFEAKRRPTDNPLIVHLARSTDAVPVARRITSRARLLMDAFFPGPLTVVLPRHPNLPPVVTGNLDTVAVRAPALELTRTLLNHAGVPVAAPSANISGRPSATTWTAALEDLDGRVACILKGPPATEGLESTVVDCISDPPVVLRPGAVTLEALKSVVPSLATSQLDDRRSPGMRHRHYAPRAFVRAVAGPATHTQPSAGYIGVTAPAPGVYALERVVHSSKEYAHDLFDFLRACDRAHLVTIHCQRVPKSGLGTALMDRIQRAARGSA